MTKKSITSQRERIPRLPANDRVHIEGIASTGWTVNWSSSGSCVIVNGNIKNGQRLNVEFPDRYARGEAQVIWTQPYTDGCLAGLEFITLERRVVMANLGS